ncbi:MAG: GTPase HflX, partial [Gammaproteobacteria bacterium]|nr:GTPase HflX [Gammaproteobacteria bacterium]
RQKGGIGLRGPGETQLETDRRLLRERIKYIERRLDKVRKTREQGRRARSRASVPTVSLVGYTNAGKSTLFNRLSSADVFAANQLFATLDPTMRRIEIDDVGPVVLADTVGFISHLPHRLVEAFRATLEEAAQANLLLHVVDASDLNREDNIGHVNEVLREINAHELPSLLVYNKIDLLSHDEGRIDRDEHGVPWRVWVSAVTGAGIPLLAAALRERLGTGVVSVLLSLDPADSKLRAKLHELGVVQNENYLDNGRCEIDVRINSIELSQLRAHDALADQKFTEAGFPKPEPEPF